jgi:WD40 repeat protein
MVFKFTTLYSTKMEPLTAYLNLYRIAVILDWYGPWLFSPGWRQVRLGCIQWHLLRTLGLADVVQRITFSPDGKRLISGGVDGAIKLWDIFSGQELTLRKLFWDL